jgi:naphthoate synthase/2-ketocyclohexanecarboxyl-CoA hydrolase
VSDVLIEERGPALWIRLNRPERRNAYDAPMAEAIAAALEDASTYHAVVITGSDGAFCAGGALTNLSEPDMPSMRGLYKASLRLFDAVRTCPRPVIAAVNGAAAGGGNELVVACDLAIAARSATFGQTGPKVGSSPVTGATNVMGVQIGEKRAKEMAMLCRRYSAERAYEMGLVNEVVDDDALEDAVTSMVDELTRLSPRYVEITKISSNLWWNSARDSFSNGLGMLVQAIGSPDMREGAASFMEKRKPRFPDPE